MPTAENLGQDKCPHSINLWPWESASVSLLVGDVTPTNRVAWGAYVKCGGEKQQIREGHLQLPSTKLGHLGNVWTLEKSRTDENLL